MAYLAALHFGVAYGSNEICKEYPYPHAKDCPTYDPALVWLWQIGETLNFWSPAVAAVAAVAVAAFTLTLKWSTDRQAQFTGESIKLAKEQFESEHRPWVGVEHEEPAGEISIYARETIVSIKLDLINTGSCPAFDFFIEGDVIGIKDESKINDVIKTLKTKILELYKIEDAVDRLPTAVLFPGKMPRTIPFHYRDIEIIVQPGNKRYAVFQPIMVGVFGYKTPIDNKIKFTTFAYTMALRPSTSVLLDEHDMGSAAVPVEDMQLRRWHRGWTAT